MKKIGLNIAILLVVNFCLAQQGINSLKCEITLSAELLPKKQLLDTISKIANVHFSYNPELINDEEIVTIDIHEQKLYVVLEKLIDNEKVAFKAIDNQIVFYPKYTENIRSEKPSFLLVRGQVRDKRKGIAIPFCNVAIVGKAIGTMTNADGKFSLKVPVEFQNEHLGFSCIGYLAKVLPIANCSHEGLEIELSKTSYHLKPINVVHYDPVEVLHNVYKNIEHNYDDNYNLYTSYYREIVKKNDNYIDVSEAVLEVMKSPYNKESSNDYSKFIKGRKSTDVEPYGNIRLKLKGGPYYISMLDVVKNRESFIHPDFITLYEYEYKKVIQLENRNTIVIDFKPLYQVREMLYKGTLFIDAKTWAVARVEFKFTKKGLRATRNQLIKKEPKKMKAVPTVLEYTVQYKYWDDKWYFMNARSNFQIRLIDRKQNQKDHFESISEILTTNVEKGELKRFSRRDVFKANEFFTDKIISIDRDFWEAYNVIRPEEALIEAMENFENYNLLIRNRNHSKEDITTKE